MYAGTTLGHLQTGFNSTGPFKDLTRFKPTSELVFISQQLDSLTFESPLSDVLRAHFKRLENVRFMRRIKT